MKPQNTEAEKKQWSTPKLKTGNVPQLTDAAVYPGTRPAPELTNYTPS
ncbi:hypothetical protein GCM10007939_20940 [Amylibacter marinus]|uniref:Uncharacterized protein n=1 Tax=Amylibacter marinus TaxID=1475483 RepID=A0ABQ5VX46_9RHOB|nr:hypothetical protein [Amylibacter marinus]GLQ35811.1 hypothetical protein GCM10007939_20940 [Amylibacter marinus]